MRKQFKILILLVVIAVSLLGCRDDLKGSQDQAIEDMSQVEIGELMKYKDSYLGDNSAVGNILLNLPMNRYGSGFSLQTDEEPYQLIVKYGPGEESDTKDYNEFWMDKKPVKFLENNAIVLFSLIRNVENIQFNVDNTEENTYEYNRKELEAKFNKDLTDLSGDRDSFNKFFKNK